MKEVFHEKLRSYDVLAQLHHSYRKGKNEVFFIHRSFAIFNYNQQISMKRKAQVKTVSVI